MTGEPGAKLSTIRRRLRTDSVLRNSLGLIAVNLTASGFGFLVWAVAARLYETATVGAVSAYTTALPLVTTLAGLGMSEVVIRHYHNYRRQRTLVVKAAMLSGGATAAATTGWWLLGGGHEPLSLLGATWWQALLVGGGVVASTLSTLTTATIIASRRTHLLLLPAGSGGLQRLLMTVVLSEHGTIGLAVAFAIGSITETAVGFAIVGTHTRPVRHQEDGSTRIARGFIVSNWFSMAVSLAPRALVVSIVAARSGAETAAYVGVPLLAMTLLTMIPAATSRAVFAEAAARPDQLGLLLRRGAARALAGTVTLSALVALTAPWILEVFGSDYTRESTGLLRLLALSAVAAIPNYFIDVGLNVRGAHRLFLTTNVLGTGALLAALTVASVHGAAGVGVGWIAGQLAYSLIGGTCWLLLRRQPERHRTPAPA